MSHHHAGLADTLHAPQADAALQSKLTLYGRFVGAWALDVSAHQRDGSVGRAEGELHFGWVLGGKAVQDTWIYPARHLRGRVPAQPWHAYGSILRWYDPGIDAWHIAWFDPHRAIETRQIGRAVGSDIVQVGEDRSGLLSRWRFVEIGDRSFTWLGERSWDKGATWTLLTEMHASREA